MRQEFTWSHFLGKHWYGNGEMGNRMDKGTQPSKLWRSHFRIFLIRGKKKKKLEYYVYASCALVAWKFSDTSSLASLRAALQQRGRSWPLRATACQELEHTTLQRGPRGGAWGSVHPLCLSDPSMPLTSPRPYSSGWQMVALTRRKDFRGKG